MKRLFKLNLGFLVVALVLISSYTQAQFVANEAWCKEFNSAPTIYVIENTYSTKTYKTSTGEEFTFLSLVKKNWSKKSVQLISLDKYNSLADVKNQFYISLCKVEVIYGTSTSMYGIIVEKGKSKMEPAKSIAWMFVDIPQMEAGYMCERMFYNVQNLHDLMENYDDKSERKMFYYKRFDKDLYLTKKTLLLRDDQLSDEFKDEASIKKAYPYPFKIVTKAEWEKAIVDKKNDVIIVDDFAPPHTGNMNYAGYYLWNGSDGKLLVYLYPCQRLYKPYQIDKTFFKNL